MNSAILITYDKEDAINEAKGLCDAAGYQVVHTITVKNNRLISRCNFYFFVSLSPVLFLWPKGIFIHIFSFLIISTYQILWRYLCYFLDNVLFSLDYFFFG